MFKQAFALWRSEKRHKGTTLQRRLVLFFVSVTVVLILMFAFLLTIFGINGKEEKAVHDYISNEMLHASDSINSNFGRLSHLGIELSTSISDSCDTFFKENNMNAGDLSNNPELLEPLLSEQMPLLMSTMNNNYSSGVFILLDATVNPMSEKAETARAGIYIKETQPVAVQTIGAKYYCLRGSAQIARDNGIELLGQWKMEYDITDEDFFNEVIETARENSSLPLTRLYYWTGRVTLHDNSEASFLLCVPLRSSDGTVFGVCGIEVSNRMFKQLYSPQESDYRDVFVITAPLADQALQASMGLIAGNAYLTGYRMKYDLDYVGTKKGFDYFKDQNTGYGGMSDVLKLYPADSPYAQNKWSVAVLMSEQLLKKEIKGNSAYLLFIIAFLLLCSLSVSVVISNRYLSPVKKALDSIQKKDYASIDVPYLEINDLFEFLEEKDNEHEEELHLHEEELRRRDEKYRGVESKYQEVHTDLTRLTDKKMQEIDTEGYHMFLANLSTLTKKEREVFNLYLAGKSAKEIIEQLAFSDNALKYHNKNIYSKLGVSSRKELLIYATLMKKI